MRSASIISIVLTAVIFILFLRTQLLFGLLPFWNASNINDPAVLQNYSYHAILAVCGFYVCQIMTSVIYSLCPDKEDSKNNFIIHVVFGTCGIILISLSLIAACRYKDFNLQPHLVSSHAWIGILAIVLYMYNYINGILSHIFWDASKTIWEYRHHFLVGIMALYATSVSINTGIAENTGSYCFNQVEDPAVNSVVNFVCRSSNTVSLLTVFVFFSTVVGIILRNSLKMREEHRVHFTRNEKFEEVEHSSSHEFAEAQGTNVIL